MQLRRFCCERGATFTEYLIAAMILAGIFVVSGQILQESAKDRSIEAAKTEERMVPCEEGGTGLGALGGEACF